MSVVNTVDLIGDEVLASKIIGRNIVEIVDDVTINLGASAFRECAVLKSADFAAVTNVGNFAFYDCSALKTLILRSKTMCTIGTSVFSNTPIASVTGYVYVPSALVDSYKTATNWRTYANQFRKLEEWTVDGTTTGELDIENRHMVRFFNSDGTLLGYKVVTTGSSAVYDGTPVKPDDPSDEFIGFDPMPINVTEDMDCYAQYQGDIYTWPMVLSAIADGTYKEKYAIGDTVPLDLGTEGLINMQIVAFDTDDLADGSGKAPITWISKELLVTKRRINTSVVQNDDKTYQEGTGGIGGWEKTELRAYLKNSVKPSMSVTVRNAIREVRKNHPARDTADSYIDQTTIDDVWIPSKDELDTATGLYKGIFSDNASRAKKVVGTSTSTNWWTRSVSNYASFYIISNTGGYNGSAAYNNMGVSLGFCT